jgi:hypothetical protein
MAAAVPPSAVYHCNFRHSGASAKIFQELLMADMKLNEERLISLTF